MGGESERPIDFEDLVGAQAGTGGASGEEGGSASCRRRASSTMVARGAAGDHDHGWARGWTEAAKDAVLALRANGIVGPIATHFVDRVRGTLRPQKGADAAAYVRQLAARLRPFRPEVLVRTAEVLLDTRGGYLPDAASVERTARTVEATLRREAEAAAKREARAQVIPPADAALAARWPELRAALATTLSESVVASWFDGLAVEALAAGVLTLRAESAFKGRWIATHYDAALLSCARQVLGLVSRVVVVADRGAAHQASGAAA